MNTDALKDLLYRLADDKLMMGHRNSEWCGMGPALEEDIAFASMAQDELGHALSYYRLLEELGEGNPDQVAFTRPPHAYRNCQLTEMPNAGDYAFSLVRQFLFAWADKIRLASLSTSSYAPLAELARKIAREVKYHQLHGKTWVTQLAQGGEEARLRLQSAVNEALPMAFGLFEPTLFSGAIAADGIQAPEEELGRQWLEEVSQILEAAGLNVPQNVDPSPFYGGRGGHHTEHLHALVDEMQAVIRLDPIAAW
jgi:ring-1,2-phenylacetyl-CoA epoxidase subunit PaaC